MKWPSLNTILLIAVGIFVYIQFRSCTDKVHKPEEMIRNEERLKYLEKERLSDSVTLFQIRVRYDSIIALSLQKSGQLKTQYQTVKTVYEKIPVIVNDLDKQQLRSGAESY
jgi:hypothetical protein